MIYEERVVSGNVTEFRAFDDSFAKRVEKWWKISLAIGLVVSLLLSITQRVLIYFLFPVAISLIYIFVKNNLVVEESLSVIRDFGVQVKIRHANGAIVSKVE